MSNYTYIIASLPDLTPDYRQGDRPLRDYIEEIKALCSEKDNAIIGLIEEGFDMEKLDRDFYIKATSHSNSFIRDYFLFDLNVRNAKVEYLNRALGRPAGKDRISLDDPESNTVFDTGEFGEGEALAAILEGKDMLARERAIDDLYWEKINALTIFNYFDINAILGCIVKMHIILRWLNLDEQTGREMFKRLVDEVRGTFKGVEYRAV